MNKLPRILSCIALLFALAGCVSSPYMTEVASQEIRPPTPDKVKIVFMRPSPMGTAILFDLFDVVDGQLTFVGVLATRTKIVYETTPGQKVFMASSPMAADFMLGNLQGGKIYYSIVRPVHFTGRVIPTPIKTHANDREFSMSSPDFASWVADTKLYSPKPEAQDWFREEKARYQDIYTDFWSRFQRKTPEEKAERTLNPEDGVLK